LISLAGFASGTEFFDDSISGQSDPRTEWGFDGVEFFDGFTLVESMTDLISQVSTAVAVSTAGDFAVVVDEKQLVGGVHVTP
jgi:hypothetical protein